MARGTYVFREILPLLAMVTVQCLNVGLSTIFKAASVKGLDYHVFLVYGYAISTLFAVPLVFFFHRNTEIPPIKFSFLLQMLGVGFVGFIPQLIGFRGIELASPTLGSVMSNLTPACTFLFAILFKMEILKIKKLSSQAKIIGTILSISGALVVVFYKGPTIITSLTPSTLLNSLFTPSTSQQSQWIYGGALLAIDYIIVSLWYILQAKVVNDYPSEIIVVLLYYLSCTIFSTPICFILQPNLSAWRIKPDITLAAILYSVSTMKVFPEKTTVVCSNCVFSTFLCGALTLFVERDLNSWKLNSHIQTIATVYAVLAILLRNMIHTWCFHLKGPIYVTMFRPMGICIAVLMGVLFLGETLYSGSIIGGTLVTLGFYSVIWGKWKEQSVAISCGDDSYVDSNSKKTPLLHCDTI